MTGAGAFLNKDTFITMVGQCSLRIDVYATDGVITGVRLAMDKPDKPDKPAGKDISTSAQWLKGIFQAILDGRDLPDSVEYRADGTEFQKKVWEAAGRVPYGFTATYGDIARTIGCGSPRAAGQALKANPIPILIPCHRIVGAGGRLTGFSSGIEIKRLLLRHEHENSSCQ